jgi:hypothetical protein
VPDDPDHYFDAIFECVKALVEIPGAKTPHYNSARLCRIRPESHAKVAFRRRISVGEITTGFRD